MYNVLILGSGGREHALAWSILKDNQVSQIFCAPGNAGTSKIAINLEISLNNHQEILNIIKQNEIDYVIVGPEGPLENGIVDFLQDNNIKVFGPTKFSAQLESSKLFARKFMKKYHIPQPDFNECSNVSQVQSVVDNKGLPVVLKADGLAAGKGVIICENEDELQDALTIMFENKKFGNAAEKLSVEECLVGEELSVFVVCDGENYKILNSAQDHKRIYDLDQGPNTGGMGAYSPTPLYSKKLEKTIERKIIQPTIRGMIKEDSPFVGFLYVGLMLVDNKPYVIEFNVRMGDPETQVVLPMLDTSLFNIIKSAIDKDLNLIEIKNNEGYAVTIVLAADGYPNKYDKGMIISGLDLITDTIIFHSGTIYVDEKLKCNGGRILNVVATSSTLDGAIKKAYKSVDKISFDKKYFRTDIGYKGIKYLKSKDN